MSRVLFDERWAGNHGIGRFASEILKRLSGLSLYNRARRPWHALDPFLLGAELWRSDTDLFFSPGYNSPMGWPGRFMFTLHDLNHLCVPDNSSALKRAYYRHVIRPACRKAPLVLTVSEYSRSEIAQWASIDEQKIINVSNGVAAPFGVEGNKYDPGYPYLLYVGCRKPHKNIPRLIEAYAISGIAMELRLVLSGTADPETVAIVEKHGLAGRVHFCPLESSKELADAYRGATAFLFPSLYEGFGLPPLEAMACGTPVVTSNVCSLPEVVGNAALLVTPREVEKIAEGIRRVVCDADVRDQLRERGPLQARKYTWEETARRTSAAIGLALGNRSEGTRTELRRRSDQLLAE